MGNTSKPELKVRFLITSDSLTPHQISAGMGVSPSSTWSKGQRVHPKASKTYDQNGWVIVAEARGESASAEKLAADIFNSLDVQRMLAFKSKHSDAEFELSVIVHLTTSAPAISLSAKQVEVLAKLGADMGTMNADRSLTSTCTTQIFGARPRRMIQDAGPSLLLSCWM